MPKYRLSLLNTGSPRIKSMQASMLPLRSTVLNRTSTKQIGIAAKFVQFEQECALHPNIGALSSNPSVAPGRTRGAQTVSRPARISRHPPLLYDDASAHTDSAKKTSKTEQFHMRASIRSISTSSRLFQYPRQRWRTANTIAGATCLSDPDPRRHRPID